MAWPTTLLDDIDPFRYFEQMRRDMDRLFEGLTASTAAGPAVNIWTNDNAVVVTAEVPGVDTKSLDVSVKQNVLTISGERPAEVESEKVSYHRRERGFGKFSRTVRLPFEIDPNNVKARYVNGVLRVELPRSESSKPKKIAISSDE